ncbi:MAG: DUF3737 family protein [Eubacterium sp.]|nr:DUF3737 family protein [Eubacterium sp.]
MSRNVITGRSFTEERPLFAAEKLDVVDCIFDVGESPLKEVSDINLRGGAFKWKYPLWYAQNIDVEGTYFGEMARAGVWYSQNLSIRKCQVDAPKEFRKCKDLTLSELNIPNAQETLWWCENVTLSDISARGDYFGMGSTNIKVSNLDLTGNYCFDGCRNVEIVNSRLYSKDCIWNAENVTIRDSYIEGEYLAWNSKDVTFINCDIKSLQGLCYVENVRLINCRLSGTSLAFEYSTVDVEVTDKIDSVMNPRAGKIKTPMIDKLIMDPSKVDVDKTIIESEIGQHLDKFDGIIN